jgi:hypothetical protein
MSLPSSLAYTFNYIQLEGYVLANCTVERNYKKLLSKKIGCTLIVILSREISVFYKQLLGQYLCLFYLVNKLSTVENSRKL